jgi:hypothetical protein
VLLSSLDAAHGNPDLPLLDGPSERLAPIIVEKIGKTDPVAAYYQHRAADREQSIRSPEYHEPRRYD